MRTKVFLILITVFPFVCFSQQLNKVKIDEKSQMEVLIGKCDRNGLKSDLFKTYFEAEYANYTPDTSAIRSIRNIFNSKKLSITIVMGSWCGDSQEQVPRFYKILDAAGIADTSITLYCVDRSKKCDQGETNNLNITLVPTFIFYKDNIEIGRITETPVVSLEKDLLSIIAQ